MPKANLYNMAGEQVGEVELSEAVFGIEPNEIVLHAAIKNHLANCRQGTQSALTKGEVSYPYGSSRRRHQALASEGHRPRPRRLQGQPRVDARRRRLCPEAA